MCVDVWSVIVLWFTVRVVYVRGICVCVWLYVGVVWCVWGDEQLSASHSFNQSSFFTDLWLPRGRGVGEG